MTRVLITGAGGFIGNHLCRALEESGFEVVPVHRERSTGQGAEFRGAVFGKIIDASTDWSDLLTNIDVVIHLAARAHVVHRSKSGDLDEFRATNVEGTRNLAKQAAQSGVKRFVFLSSIKVNGEQTGSRPFSLDQSPDPQDSYAISKFEAEIALKEIEGETEMEVVVIRPPLVYGPGVKGNLRALVNFAQRGVPLPLGSVRNRRDLISIYNLCDLIRVCIQHPAAPGNTFLASDDETISTAELARYIGSGQDRRTWVLPVPVWILKVVGELIGKRVEVEKLTGNLEIDISFARGVLGWSPVLTVEESFQKMFEKGQA